MNQEFGAQPEGQAEWHEPTNEVKEEEKEGAMGKISHLLQKLPGGKFLLPSAAIISLWGGSIEESRADAKDWLRYKNGVEMTMPYVAADVFKAGVTRKADGSYNYIVEDEEKFNQASSTKMGDLIYQSNEDISLPSNPEKFIKADLADFKNELGKNCKDKKLVSTLGNEMDKFANEVFPQGLGKDGYVNVGDRPTKIQFAELQAAELEVSEHMAKTQKEIYTIKDKSRVSVTGIVLTEYYDLIKKAAVLNMARDN
ncbi:MAG: hypothetical protein M1429_03930 [Patescibacteria group bacterium]|nr:hypothetical protein [Patescibacteria group bacterium]